MHDQGGTGGRARVLIVEPDGNTVLALRGILQDDYDVVGAAGSGEEALRLLPRLRADVVVTEMELPGLGGLEMTKVMSERHPEVLVVVVSSEHQAEAIRGAMAAGAREYLFKPVDSRELREVMERLCQRRAMLRHLLLRNEEAPGCGVWAFCSAVGGVGQTTLLLSLANELLLLSPQGVLVVDLDLSFGDVAFTLGLDQQTPTLNDLLLHEQFLESETILAHCRLHSSGLRVLSASGTPAACLGLDRRAAAEVVVAAQRYFDYVLVDLPPGLSEASVPVLDEARFIFTTSDGGLGAFKNMCRLVSVFEELELPLDRIRAVLSRFEHGTMPVADYEKVLARNGVGLGWVFARDTESCDHAIRAGQPVSRIAPQSLYTQAVRDFLLSLLQLPKGTFPKAKSRSLLRRLFG